jgi:hypothetical protein
MKNKLGLMCVIYCAVFNSLIWSLFVNLTNKLGVLYHLFPFHVGTFVFYPDCDLESSADPDPHFVELWIRFRFLSTNPDPDSEMLRIQ